MESVGNERDRPQQLWQGRVSTCDFLEQQEVFTKAAGIMMFTSVFKELLRYALTGAVCIMLILSPAIAHAQLEIIWGDSVLLNLLDTPDGGAGIQWQQSQDLVEWENIGEDNMPSLWVSPTTTTWYRAEISDPACPEPVYYSDEQQVVVHLLMNIPCPDAPTVSDADGNEYPTVQIGGQCWIAANLKTIPQTGQSWCYNNQQENCDVYGRLYNWAAAMNGEESSNDSPSGVQGVCPAGWHLPSDAEWDELRDYLDPEIGGNPNVNVAGGKLKAVELWNAPNTGASNESGFTALPGGIRNVNGTFLTLNNQGIWWSSTSFNASQSWQRAMYHDLESININPSPVGAGLSVRCIKD